MVLIAIAASTVNVPIIAAGGFYDGRGLAAALALGADGISMGTRFMLTKESILPESFKKLCLSATEQDTFYDTVFDGMPGRMVNISSMAAFNYDGMGAALYSITKAGVARMTEALAVEWARFGINVNGIAPGVFNSEMTDGMLQRIGDPAQLDSTLLYLVAPSSEFVTGTVIKVDDGQGTR